MTRDQARYRAYPEVTSPNVCPICAHECKVTLTPIRRRALGTYCTRCHWEQYPEVQHWSEETRSLAEELRQIRKDFKAAKQQENTP